MVVAILTCDMSIFCRMEVVDQHMQRPVLRHLKHSFILTRIVPEDPSTSMLIRLRPGWEELRMAILGMEVNDTR